MLLHRVILFRTSELFVFRQFYESYSTVTRYVFRRHQVNFSALSGKLLHGIIFCLAWDPMFFSEWRGNNFYYQHFGVVVQSSYWKPTRINIYDSLLTIQCALKVSIVSTRRAMLDTIVNKQFKHPW